MKIELISLIFFAINCKAQYFRSGPPISSEDVDVLITGFQNIFNDPISFLETFIQPFKKNGQYQQRPTGISKYVISNPLDLFNIVDEGTSLVSPRVSFDEMTLAMDNATKKFGGLRFANIIGKILCLLHSIWNMVSPYLLTFLQKFSSKI
ncbi:uncharacterized protein LOC130895687 [Diorhabda carinulata]|uniref:uncharacterized protein LOC130895687 n=1 Tax=Diorhabda carinulata TaxID=1163345 RepID=UPI0025A02F95|nr:uncharacterized protein LOC130895687 [Diorhabda carinulata]